MFIEVNNASNGNRRLIRLDLIEQVESFTYRENEKSQMVKDGGKEAIGSVIYLSEGRAPVYTIQTIDEVLQSIRRAE